MRVPLGLLKPDLEMTLADRDATLDLTTAVAFRMKFEQAGALVFTDESPTIDTDALKATHEWVGPVGDTPGETDHFGRGFYWTEVNFGDGKWIKFPTNGDLPCDIG